MHIKSWIFQKASQTWDAGFTETFYEVRFGPRCHTCGTSRWRHVVVFFSYSSFKSLKIYCWKMSKNTSPFVWAEILNNFPKGSLAWNSDSQLGIILLGWSSSESHQLSSDWASAGRLLRGRTCGWSVGYTHNIITVSSACETERSEDLSTCQTLQPFLLMSLLKTAFSPAYESSVTQKQQNCFLTVSCFLSSADPGEELHPQPCEERLADWTVQPREVGGRAERQEADAAGRGDLGRDPAGRAGSMTAFQFYQSTSSTSVF